MIQFMQTVSITMAATSDVVKRSSKEYKEQEALRRSRMSDQERYVEDITKFNKRIMNS